MRDGELWHGWGIAYCQKDEFLVSCSNLERSDLAVFSNFTFFFSSTLLGCFDDSFWFWVNLLFSFVWIFLIVAFLHFLFSALKTWLFNLVTDFDFFFWGGGCFGFFLLHQSGRD